MPTVSFKNLVAGADVWNTISVEVDVDDNNGIRNVQFYIDGNSVATATVYPYTLSWDTNIYNDGVHFIKAVVTDKAGNNAEMETIVNVKNTLVTLNIAPDHLWDIERGFVFLSDEKGKLITSIEYKNGDGDIALKKSSFVGSSFYLTEVRLSTIYSRTRSYTYCQIERGGNWVPYREWSTPPDVGIAILNLFNASDTTKYNLNSHWQQWEGVSSSSSTINLTLRQNPSKVFVTKYSTTTGAYGGYGMYTGIVVGENKINLNLVNRELTKSTITLPEGSLRSFIRIYGTLVANNFDERYMVGNFQQTSGSLLYNFYYPGSEFAGYHSLFYYETDKYIYRKASTSKFYGFDEIASNVTYSSENGKLTYSAIGDFDFLTLFFEDDNNSWLFQVPKGNNQVIPTLELPAALNDFTFPDFGMPTRYGVYDVNSIEDYEGLKNYIRKSNYGFNDIFVIGSEYISIIYGAKSTGG